MSATWPMAGDGSRYRPRSTAHIPTRPPSGAGHGSFPRRTDGQTLRPASQGATRCTNPSFRRPLPAR
jgi:hypothetical protein